jgi:hypothetical protein
VGLIDENTTENMKVLSKIDKTRIKMLKISNPIQ